MRPSSFPMVGPASGKRVFPAQKGEMHAAGGVLRATHHHAPASAELPRQQLIAAFTLQHFFWRQRAHLHEDPVRRYALQKVGAGGVARGLLSTAPMSARRSGRRFSWVQGSVLACGVWLVAW